MALRARIMTALVAAPVAVALILWLPGPLFAAVGMLLMAVALYEWNNLTTRSTAAFSLTVLGMLLLGIAVHLLDSPAAVPANPSSLLLGVCLAGCLLWLWQWRVLVRGLSLRRSPGLEMAVGAGAMYCAWAGLVWLRGSDVNGPEVVLVAVMVVWAADVFAYLAGNLAGRHKLAPEISPGKTIEGVIGGLVGALATAWAGALILVPLAPGQMLPWLLAAAAAALASVIGDLSVSRLKRQAGVKDSGRLLPGHGGLLDRFDGLLAAMPVFGSLWWLLR